MTHRPHWFRTLASTALAAIAVAIASSALAADPPAHVRGTIVSAAPDKLTVKTATGNVTLAIDAATKIAGVAPSGLDQIKAGTFVGIANVPGRDASSALEVVVFPDAMKGTGLGDYAWDLAPPAGGVSQQSAMTNGTVKAATAAAITGAATSAMTNGTVRKTSDAGGLVLTVDYGKGEKTIRVPSNVPVVTVVPADASKLVPGAHVFIAPKAEMPASAGFIAVGIDGTVPPM